MPTSTAFWTCTVCHASNNPLARLCETCWMGKRSRHLNLEHQREGHEAAAGCEVLIGVGRERFMRSVGEFERPKAPRARGVRGLARRVWRGPEEGLREDKVGRDGEMSSGEESFMESEGSEGGVGDSEESSGESDGSVFVELRRGAESSRQRFCSKDA